MMRYKRTRVVTNAKRTELFRGITVGLHFLSRLFIAIALIAGAPSGEAFAQALITETFSDGDSEDSSPGLWVAIRPDAGNSEVTDDGLILAGERGYPLQLTEVNQQAVAPGTNWSVRALLSLESGLRGGVGVAPDDQSAGVTFSDLENSLLLRVTNGFGGLPKQFSLESLPYEYGDDVFVQFDRTSDLAVGRMWFPGQAEDTITLMSTSISSRSGTPGLFVTDKSSAVFKELVAATSPLAMPEVVNSPLALGEPYVQDFDEMGARGLAETRLPKAWFANDSRIPFVNLNRTTEQYPLRSDFNPRLPALVNAGEDTDRSLAILKPQGSTEQAIHFLTLSPTSTANSIQLNFAIEAWEQESSNGHNDPGAAAFDVILDIDNGNGFSELANLGTISTGDVLPNTADGLLNGNNAEHRTVFTSGVLPALIPANSKMQFRWKSTNKDDASDDWIFGIDDVSITASFLGDFDDSGKLDGIDIDSLTSAIRQGLTDSHFDLNFDQQIDDLDKDLLFDLGEISAGDTNVDGRVDFADFLQLSNAFGSAGGWAEGDFDGDGMTTFTDFLTLTNSFGSEPVEATIPVPEPACTSLVMWIMVLASRRRTFPGQKHNS